MWPVERDTGWLFQGSQATLPGVDQVALQLILIRWLESIIRPPLRRNWVIFIKDWESSAGKESTAGEEAAPVVDPGESQTPGRKSGGTLGIRIQPVGDGLQGGSPEAQLLGQELGLQGESLEGHSCTRGKGSPGGAKDLFVLCFLGDYCQFPTSGLPAWGCGGGQMWGVVEADPPSSVNQLIIFSWCHFSGTKI